MLSCIKAAAATAFAGTVGQRSAIEIVKADADTSWFDGLRINAEHATEECKAAQMCLHPKLPAQLHSQFDQQFDRQFNSEFDRQFDGHLTGKLIRNSTGHRQVDRRVTYPTGGR